MASRTVISQTLPEQKTARFTALLKDELGVAIPSSSLNTLTLTLYNKKDLAIINSRNKQSILNTNGGTVDSSGNFTLTLTPSDMIVVRKVQAQEPHIALVEWTYGAGKAGGHELEFTVDNLNYIG
jgi:hypothetical protein